MALPHSLFGAQVHTPDKRHWWKRHKLRKPRRHNIERTLPGPVPAPAELARDRFARDMPAADVARHRNFNVASSPILTPPLAGGRRDAEAEKAALQHFAQVGYEGAAGALRDAHPRVILHVADAACAAGAYEASRQLYTLAYERSPASSRVPKHLRGLAQEAGDATSQSVYLWAWMATQPATFQTLAQGCRLACAMNPALTRTWYLKAQSMAQEADNAAGLEALSRALLEAQAYAMLMNRAPADAPLLQAITTHDPQLLTWVANAARVAGGLDIANGLERRAQELSAGEAA